MGRHVFGGVSSPNCNNYAFKKTADDNKVKYIPEAADTLNKNFHENGILKSVGSVSEAMTLVKNVRNTCMDVCVRLAKFVSNSKEMLISTPQPDRWQEAPDKKLL